MTDLESISELIKTHSDKYDVLEAEIEKLITKRKANTDFETEKKIRGLILANRREQKKLNEFVGTLLEKGFKIKE